MTLHSSHEIRKIAVKTQHDDLGFKLPSANSRVLPRHLLLVVWQRKVLVILGVVTGLALAILYYAQATPIYQSNAQVLVVKKISNAAGPVSGGDPRMTVMEDYLGTHLVLLKSPLIAERAVEKLKKLDRFNKLPSLAAATDPVGAIVGSLGVNREKDVSSGGPNNIINMSYRSTVPEDCGIILAAIIESYKDFLDEKYLGFSVETVNLITHARDVLLKDLSEKNKSYKEFRENSPLIWKGKEGLTVQQARVSEIEARRSTLLIKQAELGDRLKLFEKAIAEGRPRAELMALAGPYLDALDKAAAQQPGSLDMQLVPLLLQEQQLSEAFGPGHPDVVATRKKIAFVREMMQKAAKPPEKEDAPVDVVERYRSRLRHELQNAESENNSLKVLLDAELKEARRLANYEIQDETYRREIMKSEQLCDTVINRLKEINLVRDAGGFDASSISRIGPGYKVAPSLFQVIFVGLAIGLLCGVSLAYLAELSDKGFRGADEIRNRLGLPVIGHIPLLQADSAAQQKLKSGESSLDPYLCMQFRPNSIGAEAYRAVRTALYFSTNSGGHRLIQVTSPDIGDGKSTLIGNLGICIAQSGKRTIIIDADLRRPRIHKMFGLTATSGLANAISGQVAWRDAVQATSVAGLSVLPCGPLPQNPSELLTSPRLLEVLTEIKADYDFVLVDTPPLLAVTDPCVVAPRVDCVLLILRLSKQSGPHAERAREILASLGIKVLGVVVNGVTRRNGSGTYGGEHYDYNYTQNEYTSQPDMDKDSYYDEANGWSNGAASSAKSAVPHTRSNRGVLSWFHSLWI
jgi:capsular exopolysaccharide synthesis family protein